MFNLAIAISQNSSQPQTRQCHHHHHHRDHDKLEKPDRNPFLDFLTAPLQATGKMQGNQNDKEYGKYLHAHEAGNLLKG